MFHAVDVVVVNKLDLLPHLDFDLDRFFANVRAVNPAATIIQLSARTGAGTAAWYDWLLDTLPPGAHGSDDRS
jgi:hydrogenase nickel incorporation protein HypB